MAPPRLVMKQALFVMSQCPHIRTNPSFISSIQSEIYKSRSLFRTIRQERVAPREWIRMLFFATTLALASFTLEMVIAAKVPVWRKFAERFLLANMGLSLALSACLGIVFGAVGLIALTAGVISTLMSIPGYRFLYWNFDSEVAQQLGGNRLEYMWHTCKQRLSHKIKTTRQRCLSLVVRLRKSWGVFVRITAIGARTMRAIARIVKSVGRSLRPGK